jgi:HEAT repeat protein
MIPRFRFLLSLTLLALLPSLAVASERALEEQALIEILTSNRTPQEKDAACVRLKRIGTAAAVPALALLLSDEYLSHSARLALESIPGPEVDALLHITLYQTAGLLRAGIIDSIGHRRNSADVPLLADLLNDPDNRIATAAAAALGRIEHGEIPGILNAAQYRAAGPFRLVILDSLLLHGNRALTRGDRLAAHAIFLELYRPEEPHQVRSAAYRGLIATAEAEESLALITAAFRGTDGSAQIAALSMLPDLSHPDGSRVLAELLPDLAPVTQAAAIHGLVQRNDRTIAPIVLALTRSAHPNVQLAAITALGNLGDSTAIPSLLDAAASGQPILQRTARESLLSLRHGQVTDSLLQHLASSTGPVLAEIIRALGGRADPAAIPPLLELAAHPESSTRNASFRALASLTTLDDLPVLTQLLLHEQEHDTREEARRSIATLCRRAQEQNRPIQPDPIIEGVMNTSHAHQARISLLQICTLLVDPEIRAAIRTATRDPQPEVRDAAFRALCDSRDPAFLSDLLTVARDPDTASYRLQAIRGFVRLATDSAIGIGDTHAVEHLAEILEVSQRPDEQRIVLAGLATQPTPESLALVVELMDDEDIQAEAIQATIRIANGIASQQPELAGSALRQALMLTTEPGQRQRIEIQLAELDATADYITAWQVSGPYRQEGKDYAALFDIVFPPEDPASADDVAWISLPKSSSPQHPGIVDLLQSIGGEQCVAYLRTAVHSPTRQPARLELGTDDGVKAWLNGTLIHAHNVARPLTLGSDQVLVTLESGWNTLLLKITQNNLGWEFASRFTQPDGARLPSLQVDPLHAMSSVNRSAATVPH